MVFRLNNDVVISFFGEKNFFLIKFTVIFLLKYSDAIWFGLNGFILVLLKRYL